MRYSIYISRSTKLVPSLWPSFTSHSSHGISLGQVAGEKLAEVMWCFPPRHPWTGGSWPTKISWYNGNTMGEYHGNIMGKSCVHKWECDGKFHMYLYMEIIWEIIYQSTGSSSFGSFLSDGGVMGAPQKLKGMIWMAKKILKWMIWGCPYFRKPTYHILSYHLIFWYSH